MARSGGNINLTADNRLDAGSTSLGVKLQGTKHVSMIGNSHCRHAIFTGSIHQIANANGTVEQAVLGMAMEMDKVGVLHEWHNLEVRIKKRNCGLTDSEFSTKADETRRC
jgi:hypothetical protein